MFQSIFFFFFFYCRMDGSSKHIVNFCKVRIFVPWFICFAIGIKSHNNTRPQSCSWPLVPTFYEWSESFDWKNVTTWKGTEKCNYETTNKLFIFSMQLNICICDEAFSNFLFPFAYYNQNNTATHEELYCVAYSYRFFRIFILIKGGTGFRTVEYHQSAHLSLPLPVFPVLFSRYVPRLSY